MDVNFNTPSEGPWDYEEIERDAGEPGKVRTEGTGEFRLYLPEDTFTDVDGRKLTQQNRAVFTGPRAKANARLAASSPKLYRALEHALDVLARGPAANPEDRQAAMKEALEALGEATGNVTTYVARLD